MLILSVALAGWATKWVSEDINKQTYAHSLTHKTTALLSYLKDAETGLRGYLLTGDEQFLEPCRSAVDRIDGEFSDLHRLVSSNPAHLQLIDSMQP